MTANEILSLAKANLGGGVDGGGVNIHTNDVTIRLFMKRAFLRMGRHFPNVQEISVPPNGNFVDIPPQYKVWSVLEVVPLRGKTSNTGFEIFDISPAVYQIGSSYKDSYSHVYDYINSRMNMRAMQVLVGKEFAWSSSLENPNRIYLDDTPSATVALYVRFISKAVAPPLEANDPLNDSVDYDDKLSEYVLRDVTAQLKIAEGRLLRKLKGGAQAAETDGAELMAEGQVELDALNIEVIERGNNITNT